MNDIDFKWDAKLYQQHSPVQYELGLRAIEKLNPQNNENILEIGCGNGILTTKLAKLIPHGKITAIEPSKEMTEQAKENLAQNNVPNVMVINLDATKIKYENEFDAVFSNSAIHWIKNQELIYGLIYTVLKNNGRIMIQTGLKQITKYAQALINVGIEFKEYLKDFKSPWRFLTKKETQNILEIKNFKEIEVEQYPYIAKFQNEDDLINYFKAAGFVPFANVLPKSIHNEFIQKYKENLFEINQPNPLHLKMDRLFITAKKIL
ncbi:MAG: methyltransferase domain-containing protein [Promethearchaeota archaeon]|nr:MAG: methyltransferase domain-containing protein [Candidatus Lokiarchaeota archaeon]